VTNGVFIVTGDHDDNLSLRASVDVLERFFEDRLVHGGRGVE